MEKYQRANRCNEKSLRTRNRANFGHKVAVFQGDVRERDDLDGKEDLKDLMLRKHSRNSEE